MKQRIITAIVLAAIFIPTVLIGKLPFLLLIYIMASIGLFELLRMKKLHKQTFILILSYILLWVVLLPNNYSDILSAFGFEKIHIVFIGGCILLLVTVATKNHFTFDDAGFILLAIVYVGVGFYYIRVTREMDLTYILFVLFTIWATDSGAYFVGRAIGKRKLWPEISPKKTIEGFFGGLVFGVLVGIIFYLFTPIEFSFLRTVIMSVLISIFGQLGDLVQSAYKRHYGVKDAGNIFPGHGGILDRTDSWIFVFPILHLFHVL